MSAGFSESAYAVRGVLGTTAAWTSLAAMGPGPGGEPRWYVVTTPHTSLFPTAESVQAFLAEAQRLTKLEHDGIASLVDHGIDANLGPFLVRQFLPGETLAALTSRLAQLGRLMTPELAASLGALVADALEHAAKWWSPSSPEVGVFHGALDARSVLLGVSGTVKLLNMGLERALRFDRLRRARAPEDVVMLSADRARGQGPTPAADLHALGALLWEATTGQPLLSASSAGEALAQLAGGRIPSPQDEHHRQAASELPPDFVHIIERLVANSAEQRFGAAAEVARELRRFSAARGAFLSANDLARILRESFPDRLGAEPRILAPWTGQNIISATGRPSMLPAPRPESSFPGEPVPLFPQRGSYAPGDMPRSSLTPARLGPAPRSPTATSSGFGGTPGEPWRGRTPVSYGHWSDGTPMGSQLEALRAVEPPRPSELPRPSVAPWSEGTPIVGIGRAGIGNFSFGDDPRGTPLPQIGDETPGYTPTGGFDHGGWNEGTPALQASLLPRPPRPLEDPPASLRPSIAPPTPGPRAHTPSQLPAGPPSRPSGLVPRATSISGRNVWGDGRDPGEASFAAVYQQPPIPRRTGTIAEPLVIPPARAPSSPSVDEPPPRSSMRLALIGVTLMVLAGLLVWAADRARERQEPAFVAPLDPPRSPMAEIAEPDSPGATPAPDGLVNGAVTPAPSVTPSPSATPATPTPANPTPAPANPPRVAPAPPPAPPTPPGAAPRAPAPTRAPEPTASARPAPSPEPEGELDLSATLLEDAREALGRGDARGAEKLAMDCIQYGSASRCLRVLAEAQEKQGHLRQAKASLERYLTESLGPSERAEVVARVAKLEASLGADAGP